MQKSVEQFVLKICWNEWYLERNIIKVWPNFEYLIIKHSYMILDQLLSALLSQGSNGTPTARPNIHHYILIVNVVVSNTVVFWSHLYLCALTLNWLYFEQKMDILQWIIYNIFL